MAAALTGSSIVEDALTLVVEYLELPVVLAAAAVSKQWLSPARSDGVWVRLCRQKWQFGPTFGAPKSAAPGERDASSLQTWLEASLRRGQDGSREAFRFYQDRCSKDREVRGLVTRLAEAEGARRDPEAIKIRGQLLDRSEEALDELLAIEAGCRGSDLDEMQRQSAVSIRREMSDLWAGAKWKQLMAASSDASTLEEGALVLSQWAKPDADVASMRAELDRLAKRAQELGAQRPAGSSPAPCLEEAQVMIGAINRVLYEENHFQGNSGDYYNAENSLLHAVLEKQRGIPISLCIVWAAVARRCGLQSHLLAGFPQHLLIRVPIRPERESPHDAAVEDLYIDAFAQGQMMKWEDLCRFAAATIQQMLPVQQMGRIVRSFVEIQPPVYVYMRLLRNLLGIFQQQEKHPELLGVIIQMRALGEDSPALGRLHAALSEALGRRLSSILRS